MKKALKTGNRVSENAVGYAGGMLLPSTRMAEKSKAPSIQNKVSHQLGKKMR